MIEEKLEKYGHDYLQLYTDVYNRLKQDSSSSIEGTIIGGMAKASSFLGKALSKVPVLEKGPVDEALQDAGSSLKELNQNRQMKALEALVARRENSALPFSENITMLDRLYSGKATYYLDGDSLYCEL